MTNGGHNYENHSQVSNVGIGRFNPFRTDIHLTQLRPRLTQIPLPGFGPLMKEKAMKQKIPQATEMMGSLWATPRGSRGNSATPYSLMAQVMLIAATPAH